jgi:hypothetical protein
MKDIEPYIATTVDMLEADGLAEAANILRLSEIRVDKTGFDNWNGGTDIWTVYAHLPSVDFTKIAANKEQIQEQISARFKLVIEPYSDDWFSILICPKVTPRPDWRNDTPKGLNRLIRQNILDGFKIDRVHWSGALNDVEFLSRIYDLKTLPSHDSRFKDAAGDIWQHRINNDDWDNDWIFGDNRFKLTDGPEDNFLRFLCEMVHPVVRPDKDEAIKLVKQINDQLKLGGWSLEQEELIAGRPRFVARKINTQGSTVSRAKNVADALDAGWMQKEIERMEHAIERDPALAIGTAKDLVETCCKTILTKRNVEYTRSADIPQLTKLLAKELKLVPDGISDETKGVDAIKSILRNLSALTHYVAELRGLYGSGHGRDGKHKGLEPRHARLAVATAVAFIDFVTETYRKQSE